MSVLELLEAIHHATQDKVIAKLDELLKNQEQMSSYLIESAHLIEQVLRDTTRTWHFTTNNLSSEVPGTFVVMPGSRSQFNLRNIFDEDLALHLLCQHPAAPHLVAGEKGYSIPKSREWWSDITPWLHELIKYLKYIPQISGIAEAYMVELNLEILTSVLEAIPDLSDDTIQEEIEAMISRRNSVKVQGVALRKLKAFLDEVDPSRHWYGLSKVATNDGNIL